MAFFLKLTAIGKAKLAAHAAGGPVVRLANMAVGDGGGNPISTNPLPPNLINKVYEHQLNSLFVNKNDNSIMMAELVLPSDVGGFAIREISIKDVDGDTFAIGAFPDTYKPLAEEGATREMIIYGAMKVGDASAIQLIIDTSIVIATRPWVLATITAPYLIPGGLTGQALVKKSNADGDFEWKFLTDAINVAVDVIKEPQTAAAGQDTFTLTLCTTDAVAVYVNGLREYDFAVQTITKLKLLRTLSAGDKLLFVQNEPNEPLKLRKVVTSRAFFIGQI